MKDKIAWVIVLVCLRLTVCGQAVPTCNTTTNRVTFTDEYTLTTFTNNSATAPSLRMANLFEANADMEGGIRAEMNAPTGYVELSVFSYDVAANAVGKLLYSVKLTATETTKFAGIPAKVRSGFLNADVMSDQVKILLQDAAVATVDAKREGCSVLANTNLFEGTLAAMGAPKVEFQKRVALYECLKAGNYREFQPIVVQIKGKSATLYGVKIPGLTDGFNACDYLQKGTKESVDVYVNGVKSRSIVWDSPVDTKPINIKMGDSVSFALVNIATKTPNKDITIEGIPRTWVTPYAGDMYYYCSPSVSPGEFNPWIGLDSRVHTLMMLKYPKNFEKQVAPWEYDDAVKGYSWGYTADRLMDATKTKYSASYTWPKFKVLDDGTHQRNNQKEGLNIQYLTYWRNWQTSDFQLYDGNIDYMMGFDDDELMYLNSPYPDSKTPGHEPPPPPDGGILKLERLKWKEMPEGEDQLYSVDTGYPVQGFPLNEMVTAYRKNRAGTIANNTGYVEPYNGYEIQDNGTDNTNPNGTGTGNNMHTGKVTIWNRQRPVSLWFNVATPLAEQKGFYAAIEGTKWPSFGETNVPYTLKGLQNLDIGELKKFSMVYSSSDRLGDITEKRFYLKDLSDDQLNKIKASGTWMVNFDIGRPAYAWITAYYQRTPTGRRVMVAGKDLYPIFLLFCGVKNADGGLSLNEGEGQGSKIFLEDYRDHPTDEYNVPRKFGNKTRYVTKFTRTYVVKPGSRMTFTTWDGDPHMFYSDATEFYLGSKAMANRVPDSELTTAIKYYIGPVNGTPIEVTSGRKGKDLTYTFNTPGDYQMRVVYRNGSDLYHRIKVVNYGQKTGFPATQATINKRQLSTDETRWLGISTDAASKLVVLELNDVYSPYAYVDGYRVNAVPGKPNRWAKFNDFKSKYLWYKDPGGSGMPVENDPSSKATTYLNTYDAKVRLTWFWPNWANHYSSNWLRPLVNGVQGLPYYVGEDQVIRLYDGTEINQFNNYIASHLFKTPPPAPWQYVIPLISYTDYQGYRLRTNPSCIYRLPTVFDRNQGAFSGNPPNPPDPESIQAPDITDDQKNQQNFYYALESGQMLIVSPTFSVPTVYNVDVGKTGQRTFVATMAPGTQRPVNPVKKNAREIPADENSDAASEDTPVVTVFPNPSTRAIVIDLGEEVSGEVIVEVQDLLGKSVLHKTQTLIGVQQLEVETSPLRPGAYMLIVQYDTRVHKQRIIVQ